MPGTETITGSVERVTFRAEDTGYSILKVRLKGAAQPATVLGNTPVIAAGETISATGTWVNDPEYGRQFKADRIESAAPTSRAGIERYLGSGLIHGIGPVYAKKIVARFGTDVFDIIDNSSKRLEEVPGIAKKRRLEIKASWEKQKTIRSIMVFLYQNGVGTARALRIYKTYGERSIAILRENPYQLARDIHGVGFKSADAIARNLGIEANAPQRLAAGVLHVLQTAAERGHCALPEPELLESAAELLDAPADTIRSALGTLLARRDLIQDLIPATRHPSPLLYLPSLHRAEISVAAALRALASRPPTHPKMDTERALRWCREKTGVPLAPAQARAVTEALRSRALIITGGPGVGKTTILKSIVLILSAKGSEVVLAAPTGRAAVRLAESSGIEARTLHRLLEYQPAAGFQRNGDHPLSGDLFVIDESSMIDLPLMDALLDALPPAAHLILVGDVDQLPSVGPGSVLRDIIESNLLPAIRLTEIFRQAGGSRIVEVAHQVNAGNIPDLALNREPGTGSPEPSSDFFFIERDTPEAIADTITRLLRDRLPQRFSFNPFTGVQVLTPMNKGRLGATALNEQLQAALNPGNEFKLEVERFGVTYRQGDKVIQTRNNYEKNIFNGDIGIITSIDCDPVSIRVRFDAGRCADYEPGELDELQLAYAITIHKSQGSEFPAVVVPLSSQHYIMLQRNLLYTAITRGKSLVLLVGDRQSLALAIKNDRTFERHSALRARLTGP